MNTFMQKWQPVWDKEDGTGGGDDQNQEEDNQEEQNEEEQGSDEPWHSSLGLDEDAAKVIGDRSAADFVTWAKQQRQAASKRSEDVIKEGGFIRPLEDDAAEDTVKEHFGAYRPADATEYLSVAGLKEDDLSPIDRIDIEAAFEIGMHKTQYRDFMAKRQLERESWGKEQAAKAVELKKEEWGDKAELNSQLVDRAFTMMKMPDNFVEALSNPVAFSPDMYGVLMDGFAKVGGLFKEGGPLDDDSDASGGRAGMSLREEQSDLEAAAGERDLTPSERARLTELNRKIAEANLNEDA